MVKQINWSPLAKEELRNLLLSSLQKHGNKEQGKVIYSLFQNALYSKYIYRTSQGSG